MKLLKYLFSFKKSWLLMIIIFIVYQFSLYYTNNMNMYNQVILIGDMLFINFFYNLLINE